MLDFFLYCWFCDSFLQILWDKASALSVEAEGRCCYLLRNAKSGLIVPRNYCCIEQFRTIVSIPLRVAGKVKEIYSIYVISLIICCYVKYIKTSHESQNKIQFLRSIFSSLITVPQQQTWFWFYIAGTVITGRTGWILMTFYQRIIPWGSAIII